MHAKGVAFALKTYRRLLGFTECIAWHSAGFPAPLLAGEFTLQAGLASGICHLQDFYPSVFNRQLIST
jgi:hypothetical protein